jgi:hypothetical protein
MPAQNPPVCTTSPYFVQADIARKYLNKVEVEEAEEDERALGGINVEDSAFLLWLSNPPVSPAAMQLHPH